MVDASRRNIKDTLDIMRLHARDRSQSTGLSVRPAHLLEDFENAIFGSDIGVK